MKYIKKFEATIDRSKITELAITSYNIDELNHLNEYINLETLYCYNNNLNSLPKLSKSLKYLNCNDNNLTSLPELPKSLEILICSNNNLTELPELPNSLEWIICEKNNLTSLPELPISLKILSCNINNLTSLPELPNSLTTLVCNKNNLPFIDLDDYKEWYKENEHIIKKEGLKYAYELSYQQKKYNL